MPQESPASGLADLAGLRIATVFPRQKSRWRPERNLTVRGSPIPGFFARISAHAASSLRCAEE